MIEKVNERGWLGKYIDLEKSKTEQDFIKQFLLELKGETWLEKIGIKNFNLKLSYKDFSFELQKQRQEIYRKFEKELVHENDTLIVIDELTIFLDKLRKGKNKDDFEDVEFFLNWLRSLRQTTGSKLRWIFCSSISIESFAQKHNLSKAINDITNLKLDEFKNEEAISFVKALADSEKLDFNDALTLYMLDKLGWNLPYFIPVLFKEIVDLIRMDENTLSAETIDKAYKKLVDSAYFNTWDERLTDYAEDERFARMILKELSRTKNGKKKNTLYDLIYSELNDTDKTDKIFKPLLKRLETDGYIMSDNDKYVFRSPLLRDFWNNRFVIK
ncbi:MAG: hypothetical protein LBT27_05995 [Prevotellaceae bacterium]|jgi:hypothetical protein|nr:hypothetical protein [Prevotellaceae bacterium]